VNPGHILLCVHILGADTYLSSMTLKYLFQHNVRGPLIVCLKKHCAREEEKFMPLCQKCLKEWESGSLQDIEQKGVSEKIKSDYISLSPQD